MLNAAKNITAGILVGYGFTAFVYFGIMTQLWVDAAPHRPNKDLGLTYRHNEHGAYTYLSEHLSVYETSPELWEREAFEEQLDGAPEATGEPGKSSAGDFGRLAVRVFFSAGAGLLAWSDMPVETAQ